MGGGGNQSSPTGSYIDPNSFGERPQVKLFETTTTIITIEKTDGQAGRKEH